LQSNAKYKRTESSQFLTSFAADFSRSKVRSTVPRNERNWIILQPYNWHVIHMDVRSRTVLEKKKDSNGLHSTLRHTSVLRAQ